MPLKLFIVEDHPEMREMLREYLEANADVDIRGAVKTGEAALEDPAAVEADLVLIDVSLPGMSGIELARTLRAKRPGLTCLMLSGHGEASYVRQALEAGAQGYVLKGRPEEIIGAIRKVAGGGTHVSEPFAQ